MKSFLLAVMMVLALTGAAQAGLDEGLAAAQSGNFEKAYRVWRPLAENGDADAQFSLGLLYENGKGVNQDSAKAAAWYRKAADQGNASAQNKLGLMLYNGEGVERDLNAAFKWIRKAAEQNHMDAQFGLGMMYSNGKGVAPDKAMAVKWYQKAADQGLADAQLALGKIYLKADGVPQDKAKAAGWLKKAAEQDNGDAKAILSNWPSIIIDKKTWLTEISITMSSQFCKKNSYFRSCFNISDIQCKSEATNAVQSCISGLTSLIPEQLLQPVEGTDWGQKIGSCAGKVFYSTNINNKIQDDKCNDINSWL